MAIANTVEARIVGTFEDKISSTAKPAFDKLESSVKAMAALAASVFATHKIKEFIEKSVEAAQESESATKRLNVALASASVYSKKYSQELQDLASEYQRTTKYSDEMVLGVFSQLFMFGATQGSVKGLTDTVLKLAYGLRIDLTAATDLVTKGLGGSFAMFSRYGIHIDDTLSKSAQMAELQKIIAQRFGGSGAGVDTYAVKIAKLNNAYDDFLEEVGRILIQSPAFLSFLEHKKEKFIELAEWVKKNADGFIHWVDTLVKTGAAITSFTVDKMAPLFAMIKGITGILSQAEWSWESYSKTVMSIVATIAIAVETAISDVAQAIYNMLGPGNLFGDFAKMVKDGADQAIDGMKDYLSSLGVLNDKTKKVTVSMTKDFGDFANAVKVVTFQMSEHFDKVWQDFLDRTAKTEQALLSEAKAMTDAVMPALEKINEEKKRIALLDAQGYINAYQMVLIQKDLARRTREATLEQLKNSASFIDNVRYGLLSLRDDTNAAGDFMQRTFKSVFEHMEDGIAQFVTTGKFELASLQAMLINIQQDIIKMTIRKSISEPASEGMASMIGKVAPLVLSLFSMGGGSNPSAGAGTSGSISNAANFYTPPQAPANISVPGGTGWSPTLGDTRQTMVNNFHFNVDPPTYMANQGQIAAEISRAVQRGDRNR